MSLHQWPAFAERWGSGWVALMQKYFFDHFNFSSAGALGAIVMGLVVKELWHRRWPHILAGSTPALLWDEHILHFRFLPRWNLSLFHSHPPSLLFA